VWVLVLAGGIAASGCDRQAPAPAAAKPASVTAPVKEADLTSITLTADAEKRLGIVTVTVERKAVARTRTVGGEVVPRSGAAVSLTAPIAGVIEAAGSMPVAGGAVSAGQPLFRIVPIASAERESLVLAQQTIETAAARRDAASRKVQRAEQLWKDGAGSRRQLEEAQAELAVAEAEVKAARDRRAAGAQSGVTERGVRVEAPRAGVVQAVHVSSGQSVAAGAALLEVVEVANVWIRVPVYAGEAADVDPNAPVRVLGLNETPDAAGAIAQPIPAPPSANAATAGVDLYYAMSNASTRLRPGERVAVQLTRRDTTTGVVVPAAALLHDAYGGTWVYVVKAPQVYTRVRVMVTDMVGGFALLSQGPSPGARVVTDGAAELFGVEFGAGK
jgi:RND family efflux transporter MFP subunit